MADAEAAGRQTVFLNLENKTVLADLDEHPFNLLKYLPKGETRIIVFLDEVQYLTDPSNFLKLLYDEHVHRLKIVATGSSAFYIDEKFRDSLAGRKKLFQLFTCSFDEYLMLTANNDLLQELIRLEEDPEARSSKLDYLRNEWELYVLYGGYPAVIVEPHRAEKVNKLKEIRDSFIKRDILESGVENETAFYNLFRILAGQSGGLVNQQELAATLRIKNTTVDRYLTILQKCFHLTLVRPFHQNLRKELVKMPKAYLIDTGLIKGTSGKVWFFGY